MQADPKVSSSMFYNAHWDHAASSPSWFREGSIEKTPSFYSCAFRAVRRCRAAGSIGCNDKRHYLRDDLLAYIGELAFGHRLFDGRYHVNIDSLPIP